MFVLQVTWLAFIICIDTRGKGAYIRLKWSSVLEFSSYRTDVMCAGPGKPVTNTCFYINENIRIEVNSVSFH